MLFDFEEGYEPLLRGDVHFLFKHRGVLSDSLICRIAFNTAFIPLGNNLTFSKTTISPDKAKKDPRFSDDLLIQFVFEDYCTTCNKPWQMRLDTFCESCRDVLKQDLLNWRAINMVVAARAPVITSEEGMQLHY